MKVYGAIFVYYCTFFGPYAVGQNNENLDAPIILLFVALYIYIYIYVYIQQYTNIWALIVNNG